MVVWGHLSSLPQEHLKVHNVEEEHLSSSGQYSLWNGGKEILIRVLLVYELQKSLQPFGGFYQILISVTNPEAESPVENWNSLHVLIFRGHYSSTGHSHKVNSSSPGLFYKVKNANILDTAVSWRTSEQNYGIRCLCATETLIRDPWMCVWWSDPVDSNQTIVELTRSSTASTDRWVFATVPS